MYLLELIPYIISSIIMVLSVYVLLRRKARVIYIALLVLVPLAVTSIDVFVPGNLTVFRQVFYSMYALFILIISVKGRI